MKHLYLIAIWSFGSLGFAQEETPKNSPQPLWQKILDTYHFIGDYEQKPQEREPLAKDFWKYFYKIPKPSFPLDERFGDTAQDVMTTQGASLPVIHMNRGKELFLSGQYTEAKKTWLSGRSRYGQNYDFHRRNDYFIALGFLKEAQEFDKTFQKNDQAEEIRFAYANAATFFNWAFQVKKDQEDKALDPVTPKALYHMGAIYYRFGRYNGAHEAAQSGLDFLRKASVSHEDRRRLRKLLAETWIQNHSYPEALNEIDMAIRQDPDPKEMILLLARAGDIYFDLNNYELAEALYGQALQVAQEQNQHFYRAWIFRGECLFWMGELVRAKNAIELGLHGLRQVALISKDEQDLLAFGALRLADALLAQKKFDKAKIAYFQVSSDFPNTDADRQAQMRRACLELPYYEGRNISHGRKLLQEAQTWPLPKQALELAQACEVSSYAQKDGTETMMEKIKRFSQAYPESHFLPDLAGPIREFQAKKLDRILIDQKWSEATSFFEQYGESLFFSSNPIFSEERRSGVFLSYVRLFDSEKAQDLWMPQFLTSEPKDNLERAILEALFLSERYPNVATDYQSQLANKLNLIKDFDSINKDEGSEWAGRFLSSPGLLIHAPWLEKFFMYLSEDNICEFVYPLWTMWTEEPNMWNKLEEVLNQKFPKMFDENKTCSPGLISFEAKLAIKDHKAKEYVSIWLSRMNIWPLNSWTQDSLWLAIQLALKEKNDEDAKTLLLFLKEKGLDKEKIYAGAQLDSFKTQIENLWNHKP